MDMDLAPVEDYSLFPWPERLWFVVGFLVLAVVVARLRPAWLMPLWLAAWLLAVAWTLLMGAPRWPNPFVVVEIVLASGIPTGLTTLWLARTRRRRLLGVAAVQALGAVVAYVSGIVAAGAIMEGLWVAI
jgi:hypothetical protein